MPIDIERARWRAAEASEVAGITDPVMLRLWRKDHGLNLGKYDKGGWRYSVLDTAELSMLPPLRKMGFDPASAVTLAHEQLRPTLRDVLINRLVHGFWSLSVVTLDDETSFGQRAMFLDQPVERVIAKLALPLPVNPKPRTPEIALRMVDAIFDYILSPPGHLRWERWRASAIARGGNIPFAQAAAELGAPAWFLLALAGALRSSDGAGDGIAKAVRPKLPKVAPYLDGVVLQ